MYIATVLTGITVVIVLVAYWLRGRKDPSKPRICVLVLGDIGRSPRMQYHALSCAKAGFRVDMVGFGGMKWYWLHEKYAWGGVGGGLVFRQWWGALIFNCLRGVLGLLEGEKYWFVHFSDIFYNGWWWALLFSFKTLTNCIMHSLISSLWTFKKGFKKFLINFQESNGNYRVHL